MDKVRTYHVIIAVGDKLKLGMVPHFLFHPSCDCNLTEVTLADENMC